MKPIPIGTKGSYAKTVGVADLASNLDPSLAAVLSTPTMVAMMEQAAMEAIKPFLDAGESSVGMTIEVSHTAATPPGHRARAEAEVTAVEGRRLEFAVRAFDDVEQIGSGSHRRAVIYRRRQVQRSPQNQTEKLARAQDTTMSNEIFDRKEVYVGRDFGGITYDITPDFVAKYIAGTGDDNPWYRGDSPLGGPLAPALILYDAVYRTLGWYLPNIFRNLHTRQEWELFAPVMVGERLTTRSVIVDRYVKRDREYVVNEVIVSNASGQIVSRSLTHQSFLLPEQTKQGFVVDKSREKNSCPYSK